MSAADAGLTLVCPACGLRFAAPVAVDLAAPLPPAAAAAVRSRQPSPVLWAIGCGLAGVGVGLVLAVVGVGVWAILRAAPASRPTPKHDRPPVPSPVAVVAGRQGASPPPATTRAVYPSTRPTVPAAATKPTPSPTVRPEPQPIARAMVVPQPKPVAPPPLLRVRPVRPPPPPPDLDDQIGRAIDRGTSFLLTRFNRFGYLSDITNGEGPEAGADALAVYALLQSARAVDRPDLAVSQPAVGRMLDSLKGMSMAKSYTTYDRSLRVQALSVYDRPADRKQLRADALYLQQQCHQGAYTYDPEMAALIGGGSRQLGPLAALVSWDNSNSQYGALGVWAAEDAGVEVSRAYWEAVRGHWQSCQLRTGDWGYTGGPSTGELTMTAAGVTTLLVAEDQLGLQAAVGPAGQSPFSPAVAKGLAWLEAGDHAVTLPAGGYYTYALYGLERAGLASGFKTFGRHDWYRELATAAVAGQNADGSWTTGGDAVIDTGFTLLFLARGRHPILYDKLRFDGAWAGRPRDVAHLARFASKELEKPLNWQVVSADADWPDWMDAPVLYVASHQPPKLTDEQLAKLRSYVQAGGLILTSSDGESAEFDRWVARTTAALFPRYPLADLTTADPIYQSLFPLQRPGHDGQPPPPLKGVSNGSRLLWVHCPADLGRTWQLRESVTHPGPFQLGLNVFIYAAGKTALRNKLRSAYLAVPAVTPVATVGLGRIVYDGGDWDPEPAAAERFGRQLLGETSIAVAVHDVNAAGLDVTATPIATLTGTAAVRLSAAELRGLHNYVAAGGVLVVDACGSSPTAAVDLATTLADAFPGVPLAPLPADHPILAGTGPAMPPVTLKLRPFAAERRGAHDRPVRYAAVGRGLVLFSDVDVTTGLLGSNTWGVDGYAPDAAGGLLRNAVLWAVDRP